MIQFQRSWARAWNGCGAQGDGGELASALLARYAEPHRRYHTLQHLSECLAQFELVQSLPPHPAEAELALWFHDAIYDVRRQDNEKLSAEWARHSLAGAGASSETVQRVSDLVMATRHSGGAPVAMDAQVVVDVDLSILGAPPERFAQYEDQIREEYAHVPIWTFRWKRAEILRAFLDRPRIYSTPHFFEHYEAPARENLERAIGGT
jgi:predicted metal-dependent HD superfamily phosphohydrolase